MFNLPIVIRRYNNTMNAKENSIRLNAIMRNLEFNLV